MMLEAYGPALRYLERLPEATRRINRLAVAIRARCLRQLGPAEVAPPRPPAAEVVEFERLRAAAATARQEAETAGAQRLAPTTLTFPPPSLHL